MVLPRLLLFDRRAANRAVGRCGRRHGEGGGAGFAQEYPRAVSVERDLEGWDVAERWCLFRVVMKGTGGGWGRTVRIVGVTVLILDINIDNAINNSRITLYYLNIILPSKYTFVPHKLL